MGMPVVIMPDGHIWGNKECMPLFAVIKIPMIGVDKVEKYISQWEKFIMDAKGNITTELVRRRLWQLQWNDLPTQAKNKLKNTGQLIIKATPDYTGSYDYTWLQVKTYFKNLWTGLSETGDLV